MRYIKLVLLLVAKYSGLFRVAQRITRTGLRILCYHGFELIDESHFRPKLFIKASTFQQRMATLARYRMQVLPLTTAIQQLTHGTLAANTVVITIDDGFHSVHRVAVPCLAQWRYPATVYVTSYYVQYERPIFRLMVQYLFWKTQKAQVQLPALLHPEPAKLTPEMVAIQARLCAATSQAVDLRNPKASHELMWDCIHYAEAHYSEAERIELSQQLATALGLDYQQLAASRMLALMTPAELQTLAEQQIDIGLHTHRHQFPSDNLERAKQELQDNHAALSRWIEQPIAHFCYPSGQWHRDHWPLLEQQGIHSSTTCLSGLNHSHTPRQALRRFLDGENIHQLEFEAEICGFAELLRSGRNRLRRRINTSH